MPPGEAKRIVETARARFVRGSPRAWWLDLAVDCAQYDSTTTTLPQVLPVAAGKVWFIPETEQADLPVYELNVDDLMSVIAECPYFEYYISVRSSTGWSRSRITTSSTSARSASGRTDRNLKRCND